MLSISHICSILHTGLNDFGIIRTAILTKQKLKDIDRHIRAFLDLLRQVFPDDLSVKELPQLLVDYCVLITGLAGFHLFIHKGQTFNYGNGGNNSGSIRDDYDNPEDLWEDNQDWYEDEDEAWDEWYDG